MSGCGGATGAGPATATARPLCETVVSRVPMSHGVRYRRSWASAPIGSGRLLFGNALADSRLRRSLLLSAQSGDVIALIFLAAISGAYRVPLLTACVAIEKFLSF